MAADSPISPVGATRPELTLSAASINNEPVELDSKPASPEQVKERRGSKEDQLTAEEREKRDQLIHERLADPAVLVDIPGTPGAEEFGKSDDAEASVPK